MSPAKTLTYALTLSGLDGSNPLAFLAALGTLRTLSRACHDQAVKLSWYSRGGTWAPALHGTQTLNDAQLLDILTRTLFADATQHPISFMNKSASKSEGKKEKSKTDGGDTGSHEVTVDEPDSRATAAMFRTRASAAANPADRETPTSALDWLSAMTSDLAPDATSQLQTARRDYFWRNLSSVMERTRKEHLHRALFQPWDYADPLANQSLHVEPSEDRRHAHQWSTPSGDPDRKKRGGMLGANRLAIEAFPFFQSIAAGAKLTTCGFSGLSKDETRWTWPLWSVPIGIDAVPSLLALSELQAESLDHRALSARGIHAVFRCRRILVGKTPNFTPAMAV